LCASNKRCVTSSGSSHDCSDTPGIWTRRFFKIHTTASLVRAEAQPGGQLTWASVQECPPSVVRPTRSSRMLTRESQRGSLASIMVDRQQPFVVGPGEGRLIDLGDFGMTVKADAGETAGVVSVLEAEEPPGFGPPIHVHHDSAEAFYVLEGEYIMYLEDREFACPAGSFIFIPLGVRHGFRVGNVPSRKLNFYFPAAMIGYFDDLAAALGRDDVHEKGLAEIARQHAMEIVGPLSERYV
jgi:mannose-6-phosphate isomerase-like protein (cupin superfamily)